MCSLKEDVKKITIVECNEKVISLFKQKILPLFLHQEKIEIVQMDAYDYAKEHLDPAICDYVFIDLWHDASDGMDIYLKFLQIERDDINYDYWIEKTIIFYLLSSLENIEEFLNNHNQLNYLEIRKKLKKNFENHCNFKKK
jgi:predicted RNA methylase